MDEEPAITEISNVSEVDANCVETENVKFIELKPVRYDVDNLANNKTDVFDKMDIDNHNVDFDQNDNNTALKDDIIDHQSDSKIVNESDDVKESAPKVNGVLKYSTFAGNANAISEDTSPNATPGKSRYGRVRKPKLSTDFISVDRKSFAILSNTTSYEHVYANDTSRKVAAKIKKRRKSVKVDKLATPKPDQSLKSLTQQYIEKDTSKLESTPADEKESPKPVESIANTQKPIKSNSNKPKFVEAVPQTFELIRAKQPKISKSAVQDSLEPSSSPLISKDTIKTYSRKGETSATSSSAENDQAENVDEVKQSQISHVELSWKVGDVAWAKIGCYSYWPSIVTLEYGSSIYVKSVGNRRLAVHVQFFGDRGRRSWVLTTSLIKYQSKEQFFDLKKQYKKDKIKFKYFLIKPSFNDLWEKAVTEADTVLKLPHEERIPYYQSLYPVSEKSLVADLNNSLKSKRPIVKRRKNPEERRGRKRKISDNPPNLGSEKLRQSTIDFSPSITGDEKLPNSETTEVKKRQPIDEHIKKRRAFMRRMNKILRQSNNNDYPVKKKPKNRLKEGGKNFKFNKLLDKENEKNKLQKSTDDQAAGSSSSPDSDQKKKDISVYDFESDEETDVFIGTYNSRFTPQILVKIEQGKDTEKDESKKPFLDLESESSRSENKPEDGNLSSNEIKARRLFSTHVKRPKDTDHVRPKGVVSKFSKLFEHRKSAKGIRGRNSQIVARHLKMAHTKPLRKIIRKNGRDKAPKQEHALIVSTKIKDGKDAREVGYFNIFKEKMIEKVEIEHPQFTDEQVRNYLEKLWHEMGDSEKAEFQRDDEFTSDDGEGTSGAVDEDMKSSGNENDDDSNKSDEKRRSSSPSSSILPSSSKPKKLFNIFTGYKAEKVCQICEKPGDTVRCRGFCGGTFHVECVEKLIADKNASPVTNAPRRGRRKKSSFKLIQENSTSVESTKLDVDLETARSKRCKEPAICRRSKKSIEMVDMTKYNSDKSKDEELARPALRRSRRTMDKVQYIVNKEGQKSKDESDPSSEVKKETDDEAPSEFGMSEKKLSAESTVDDQPEQEKKDVDERAESKKVDDADIEKSAFKVDKSNKLTKKDNENENIIFNDGTTEQQSEKNPFSNAEKITKESSKSRINTGASKKDNSIDKPINGADFMCHLCAEEIIYPCFVCGKNEQEKTGETERISCHQISCAKVFHTECLKSWPQATWITNNSKPKNGSNLTVPKESLLCPQHYCHTCISDNPAALKNRQGQAKLIRCVRCPTTYHQSVYCIPAGSELLTTSQIICPRHYVPPKMKSTHVNTSWCFICCIGGSLICCEECPTSFHAECLKLSPEEYEGRYICDDCQTGRYLLYGEIVWVKLGHYRWWPAQVLYPQEIPENIAHMPHNLGEFAVKFFGSHDYNWVNRGRAFVYQEGDSGKKNYNRTVVDLTFEKALKETEEAYEKLKTDKALRDEEAKLGLKPPRYVRIKSNKPIGNVRTVELNTSNIPECRCDPNSERPCAPESDCLNRILMVECNPRVCSAGERCLNQAFEKRVYPPLIPCRTDKRGWGLKTLVDIKKGDFIIEYVGEMIDEEEYKRRVNHMYKNQEENYYFLTIDQNRMLDAGPKGNVARFMNHSCDPNCETQKWTVNGDTRIGLFAVTDIPANSELVFNYNLATTGNEKKPCLCGSEKCSGFIGVKAVKNGNNGNNGGSSNSDEDSRRKSTEENRKKSSEDAKNVNGAKSSSINKKVRKKTARAGKKKRKTLLTKRSAPTTPSSTLPIKKRKLSSNIAQSTYNVESEKKSDLKSSNSLSQSNSNETEKTHWNPTDEKPASEAPSNPSENPPSSDFELKNDQNIAEEGDSKSLEDTEHDKKTDTSESDDRKAEKMIAVQVPKFNVPNDSVFSTHHNKISKPKRSKKGSKLKKCTATNRGRGKKMASLRKRNEKISQKHAKKLYNSEKMAAAVAKAIKTPPTIKVKSIENRVVRKRGRKPHLTEEDREQALYRSLKKRLHKKLRAMVGFTKLEEDCFICNEKGELIFCDNKKCAKGYHIGCVKKLFKLPKGRWLCPWHYCTVCKSKCKVIKCSRCINSFCRMHIDDNIYITCEEALICKDHKSEYLADKLQALPNNSADIMLHMSTDNDSLNQTDILTQVINPDSLLIPLRVPKPRPKLNKLPKLCEPATTHILPPFIEIKQEALSDSEIDPEPIKKPVYFGVSRNVARRSKKLIKKSQVSVENHSNGSLDNMSIDEFIEIHHVESIEVSATESSDDEAQSNIFSTEEEDEEVDKPNNSTIQESDDDYLDVEMEEIQDDSN